MRWATVGCALAALLLSSAASAAGKPALPPGRDPGGVAIALFSTGIDYTLPGLAARLARDGEGELIGWDAVDGDNRPFPAVTPAAANWGGDGTLLAREVGAGRRLVPVRIGPTDPLSLARAVAFVAATPARIAVVPMWSTVRDDWEPFRRAAASFGDLLFVVAAGDEGKDGDRQPRWPAGFGLANLLVVAVSPDGSAQPGDAAHGDRADALVPALQAAGAAPPAALAAVRAADALAGCWPRLLAAHSGAALKGALLAAAAKAAPMAGKPIIQPCPPGAAPR
jgi:hypothetical protein